MSLKLKYAGFLMRHGINYWGPFLGAGIKVIDADKDMTKISVELRETWFNRNIAGVHFGGSLYAMCDPFFMGILLHHLGKDFVVWDKEAKIKFKRPGKGQVRATFEISPQEIEHIRQSTINHGKMEPVFKTTIRDLDNNVIAEVEKTVYVKSKAKS
jgi:acyl-coenzyme A thioesterase PaaI-like protein